jgi:5-methylthioadenosine/S-adenosylhomocysteine deaminase
VLSVPTILAHVCGATAHDVDLLSQYPAGVAHAPKTYLKLAMGYAPVTEFRAAGVPVGLATDGAVSNNTLDIWESLRLMAMTQKERNGTPEVLAIPEALYIATRESARVFGMPDDLGDLAPGKLADVILVDVSGVHHQPLHSIPATLVYNTRASDVQTVICNGQVLMQDRKLKHLSKSDIIAQVNQSMSRISKRVPSARIQVYNP